MTTSVVLTLIGEDRPGIVESLSQIVASHDGNWVESSMLSLAGKFAGILLVRLPADKVTDFMDSLSGLKSKGLQLVAELSEERAPTAQVKEVNIELVGLDRPGIVLEITQVLRSYGINVEELNTSVESASMSAEELFVANALVKIPSEVDVEALQKDFERLANELMVDITWEED